MGTNNGGCEAGRCGCGGQVNRREFLGAVGVGSLAVLASGLPVMAGPFEAGDFGALVPADKKLDAKWVKSLFERGAPTVYRGADLKYIGMPVGGLCAGQLYLGGDGKLWHWDIFNERFGTGDGHYAKPVAPASSVDQGFSLRVGERTWGLDARGFPGVTFRGEYPIGFIEYAGADCPVSISLEAFSPFVPLNVDDSSLPATVFRFMLKNTSANAVEVELMGWLENRVGYRSGSVFNGVRSNRAVTGQGPDLLVCGAREIAPAAGAAPRKPIVFAEFEGDSFAPWAVEGTAFGKAPAHGAPDPLQRLTGFKGKALANSWPKTDAPVGKLTSPEFKIERRFINFLIGGGNHPGQTCINLLVGGKVVRTATGRDTDAMVWNSWNVADLEGQNAKIEIVDANTGGWGHIDIDQIEFADTSAVTQGTLAEQSDFGTMALGLIGGGGVVFPDREKGGAEAAEKPLGQKLVGSVSRKLSLKSGESATIAFVIAWHFPNLTFHLAGEGPGQPVEKGHFYATRFDSAAAVVRHVAEHFERLYGQTRLWHDTWYGSTLPHWFLERTLANASILATSTAQRFANGRFYGWEGVGCCAGTCTHVWHYEHAMGRLFPELDILLRERVDFKDGVGFNAKTGIIGHRGEVGRSSAADGQAGTILRAWRDHQMSGDDAFLRLNWPAIRKSIEWLISLDPNRDGLLDQPQANTLDATWFGLIPWISGLYLAALRAGEAMAREMEDAAFAGLCRGLAEHGLKNFAPRMFNGEYFEQVADPTKLEHVGSYNGCEIDQVFGQSWAWQVGLGRVLPEEETKKALRAIWTYNFAPDVGPFRERCKPGRWYAMAGEAGTLMCSWPRGDKLRVSKGYDYYFNECMNGFEHQVAGHMIWEGMLLEGLAIERAVHDRYHASRRNPWNEVECGDHYARSMASYGVFLAACGFEYHGPTGRLAFAPRIRPENFKAAFTAAEGWGEVGQKVEGGRLDGWVEVRSGKVRLKNLGLALPLGVDGKRIEVTVAGEAVRVASRVDEGRVEMTFGSDVVIEAGRRLAVSAQ
jgi:non-lysosomal glucosylceramidase